MDHHAPDDQFVPVADFDQSILCVFRDEQDPIVVNEQAFYGQISIDDGDYDGAGFGFTSTVHHEEVPVMNACTGHGVALHPNKKRGRRMLNEPVVQIKTVFQVVIRG